MRRTAPLPQAMVEIVVEHRARRARSSASVARKHLDALGLAVQFDLEPGAGMRREAADTIVQLGGRTRPVDACLAGLIFSA